MTTRLFTVEEANRLLRPLEEILSKAQTALAEMREARDQLVDLQIIWGDRVQGDDCPDRAEYEQHRQRFSDVERRLQQILGEAHRLGCEVKDVELGLVDFQAARGEEVVYLCWRRGEDRVRFWHSLSEGYAGRRPIEGL